MCRTQTAIAGHFTLAAALTILIFSTGPVAKAQQAPEPQSAGTEVASSKPTTETNQPAANRPEAIPAYADLIGIRLGMSADEVRAKVDNLKDKSKSQDFFVFSESKSAQVYYDAQGKVMALSIDYVGKNSEPPVPEQLLGETLEAKPDGSMHKLKRYPEAGYWIAYNRTAGENPIITVTVQKM